MNKTQYYIYEDLDGNLHVMSEDVEIRAQTVRVRPSSHNRWSTILKIEQVGWYYRDTPEKAIAKLRDTLLDRIQSANRAIKACNNQLAKLDTLSRLPKPSRTERGNIPQGGS